MTDNQKTTPQDQSKAKAAEHKPGNKPAPNPVKTDSQRK